MSMQICELALKYTTDSIWCGYIRTQNSKSSRDQNTNVLLVYSKWPSAFHWHASVVGMSPWNLLAEKCATSDSYNILQIISTEGLL